MNKRWPPKTVLASQDLRDGAQNARVEFAVNPFGRAGRPVLEEIRKALWELADTMTEQCDGHWIIATRVEVARRLRETADQLKAITQGQLAPAPQPADVEPGQEKKR